MATRPRGVSAMLWVLCMFLKYSSECESDQCVQPKIFVICVIWYVVLGETNLMAKTMPNST